MDSVDYRNVFITKIMFVWLIYVNGFVIDGNGLEDG